MSNTLSPRRFAIVSATLVVAFLGGLAAASAQTTGGNGRGADGGHGSGNTPKGAVILLGTPGNCPPTIACAPTNPDQPRKPKRKSVGHCDEFRKDSPAYLRCRREM
jgi:hypothetical protein